MNEIPKIVSVIGLGYIGLPTSIFLASKGLSVRGYDKDPRVVDILNSGRAHITEPGLPEALTKVLNEQSLAIHDHLQEADIYIICVPTPTAGIAEHVRADLSYVFAAVNEIVRILKPGDMVILESTSPVGTTQKIEEMILASGFDRGSVHIGYCPERVLPGNIFSEFEYNDRIVGGTTSSATKLISSFYENVISGKVLGSNTRTAELCKLVENSFRDVNIAFANELSLISDTLDVDVFELIKLANHHPRVNILKPGIGVGGHCLAVDPWFIVSSDSIRSKLIRQARLINEAKPKFVTDKILEKVAAFNAEFGRMPKVGCFGVTYKPDIEDTRESPALEIVSLLELAGVDVIVSDPFVPTIPDKQTYEPFDALNLVDFGVVLVPHSAFINDGVIDSPKICKSLDFGDWFHD